MSYRITLLALSITGALHLAACAAGDEIDDGKGSTPSGGSSTGGTSAGGDGTGAQASGGQGQGGQGQGGQGQGGQGQGGQGGTPIDCSGTTGWSALGAPLDAVAGDSDAYSPTLVLAGDGVTPIVAWSEGVSTADVHVAQLDSSGSFTPLGGALSDVSGDTFATQPVVAFDRANNALYVAWSEWDGSATKPRVKVWNGASWDALGSPLGDGPMFSFNMSLEIDPSGAPVLAWNESDGTATNVRVARWAGSAWQDLGAPLSAVGGGSAALSPSLAFEPSTGTPTVGWQESSKVYISTFNGASWIPFDTAALDLAGIEFGLHIAYDAAGTLVAAFAASGGEATDSFVYANIAGSWTPVVSDLDAAAGSGTNAVVDGLDLDAAGDIVVAWSEKNGSAGVEDVYVSAEALGGFALVGGGALSAEPGSTGAFQPDVIVDDCGRFIVAWSEDGTTARRVHVWRYQEP